jgi:flagellar L-ring protein precursor FlgH
MKRSLVYVTLLGACSSLTQVGKAPEFSPLGETYEQHSLYAQPMPDDIDQTSPTSASSIWSANESSLFGDRRAATRGDILTVVIEIDESAEISNTSGRNRTGSQNMAIPSLFGIPERIEAGTNGAVSLDPGISTNSSSTFKGTGSVSRNEKLTLRVAATVVEVLPNGVLRIEGQQEVRVNFELRELTVSGYVRPSDISRQNEITYDKIAGAQISYGGHGQISDVQQPRYGQQISDQILPF